MKIDKKFFPLLENGTKTIELRKINKLQDILNNNMSLGLGNGNFVISNNSRLKEKLVDSETNKEIGSITINGYEIVNNPFRRENEYYVKFCVSNECWNDNVGVCNNIRFFSKYLHTNISWISDNWYYLKEYFKDEKEILVLKIESFKGV